MAEKVRVLIECHVNDEDALSLSFNYADGVCEGMLGRAKQCVLFFNKNTIGSESNFINNFRVFWSKYFVRPDGLFLPFSGVRVKLGIGLLPEINEQGSVVILAFANDALLKVFESNENVSGIICILSDVNNLKRWIDGYHPFIHRKALD